MLKYLKNENQSINKISNHPLDQTTKRLSPNQQQTNQQSDKQPNQLAGPWQHQSPYKQFYLSINHIHGSIFVNQSITHQPLDQPIKRIIDYPIDQPINKLINKTINNPTSQPINQSINQSINQHLPRFLRLQLPCQ